MVYLIIILTVLVVSIAAAIITYRKTEVAPTKNYACWPDDSNVLISEALKELKLVNQIHP